MTDRSSNRLRPLLEADVPVVAVSYTDAITDDDIAAAVSEGVDVAELRIDRNTSWAPADVVAVAGRFAALPTIATIRCAEEGGDWAGTTTERVALYLAVLPLVDAIDIELATVEADASFAEVLDEARRTDTLVILSHHDFDATPPADELDGIAARATAAGADVVKVAAMAHSDADVTTLAAFTIRNAAVLPTDRGVIVIAMGEHGTQSRVFFPALGSQLTFAHGGANAVPGQLHFDETAALLRQFSPGYRATH